MGGRDGEKWQRIWKCAVARKDEGVSNWRGKVFLVFRNRVETDETDESKQKTRPKARELRTLIGPPNLCKYLD